MSEEGTSSDDVIFGALIILVFAIWAAGKGYVEFAFASVLAIGVMAVAHSALGYKYGQ